MNITSIVLTKKATEMTGNAKYGIEFTTEDNNLQRMQVVVQPLTSDPERDMPLGYIYLENGTVSCNFPVPCRMEPYFSDFDNFLDKINQEIEANRQTGEDPELE